MHIGTAAWSIPKDSAPSFPDAGTHLERYARVLTCAEINSSFYRPHRPQTWTNWAAQTPPGFRFSAKVPRAITHDARLRDAREPLARFLDEAAGMGDKLAVLLVQLPPSLAFDASIADDFFQQLAELYPGAVVCEPRHASWFTPTADALLVARRVSRVAADPARDACVAHPGGWLGERGDGQGAVLYHRWHGSPRMYWSAYEPAWLRERAAELARWPSTADRWCIFDNTAAGAATADALALQALTSSPG